MARPHVISARGAGLCLLAILFLLVVTAREQLRGLGPPGGSGSARCIASIGLPE